MSRATLVYAQLQGYERPAGEVPPAATVGLLRVWSGPLSALAHRHGARVQRILGHGLVATFGDFLGHPEHAVEGVRYALEAQAETKALRQGWVGSGWGAAFTRISVATGDVVASDFAGEPVADDLSVAGMAALAERLLSHAPPGGILASEETQRECAGRFELQAVPGFPLPGRAGLYAPALVVGARLETDPERTNARLAASADVLVRTAAQVAPGRVDNVSAGGMHVSSVLALKVGDAVEVEFAPVPELTDSSPVIVRGHVRHQRASADGSPGFGVLIDRADAADSEALRHFVALYFSAPPGDEGAPADASDFYRLELGPNYFKLLRKD